jgi:hypothetical protein
MAALRPPAGPPTAASAEVPELVALLAGVLLMALTAEAPELVALLEGVLMALTADAPESVALLEGAGGAALAAAG